MPLFAKRKAAERASGRASERTGRRLSLSKTWQARSQPAARLPFLFLAHSLARRPSNGSPARPFGRSFASSLARSLGRNKRAPTRAPTRRLASGRIIRFDGFPLVFCWPPTYGALGAGASNALGGQRVCVRAVAKTISRSLVLRVPGAPPIRPMGFRLAALQYRASKQKDDNNNNDQQRQQHHLRRLICAGPTRGAHFG